MAEVVPFPLVSRQGFISRQVRLIASMRPEVGQRHLERQLAFQAKVLLGKNIDISIVDRELTRLRAALQTAAAVAWNAHRRGETVTAATLKWNNTKEYPAIA